MNTSQRFRFLEDDYDSEYRYSQKPLPCLQGLDRAARTIYVGSFSKVVFPALGLGYAIVPRQMVTAFQIALRLSSRPGSQVDQIVLSKFIREGHFVRHLRRMRKTHAQRRDVFVAEIQKHLVDQLTVVGSAAGLHCTTILKTKTPDVEIAKRLEKRGIIARPLSEYSRRKPGPATNRTAWYLVLPAFRQHLSARRSKKLRYQLPDVPQSPTDAWATWATSLRHRLGRAKFPLPFDWPASMPSRRTPRM